MTQKVNDIVDFLVEVPHQSNVKYEYDKKKGFLRCDRILHSSMVYPGNYGYIPNTLARDGDPIDLLMLSEHPIVPMTLVRVKIIGALKMTDEKGTDEKLLAVPDRSIDPYYDDVNDINDIPKHLLVKIKHFFEHYKDTEPNKWVKISGWADKKEAVELYLDSINNYKNNNKEIKYSNFLELYPDICGNN